MYKINSPMKKSITFVLICFDLLLGWSVQAQRDTIQLTDTCYWFPPIEGEMVNTYTYNPIYFIPDYFPQVHEYVDTVPHRIYGVAVSMEFTAEKKPKLDTAFHVYFGRVTGYEAKGYLKYIKLSEYKKLKISKQQKGFVLGEQDRQTYLTYVWKKDTADKVATEETVPVYEIYFDYPIEVQKLDTAYVGCGVYGTYYAQPHYHVGRVFGPSDGRSSYASMAATSAKYPSFDSLLSPKAPPFRFLRCQANDPTYAFGPSHPIVQLRCTTPKQFAIAEKGKDSVRFEWQGHDEAENFILRMEYASTGTVIYDTLPGDTSSYVLQGVDTTAGCLFVQLQKSSHYAMKYYDTVVYSPWTDTLSLFCPPPIDTTQQQDTTITPPIDTTGNGQDTTAILLAQGEAFSLTPNPATRSTTLRLSAAAAEDCTLSLTDLAGRELQRIPIPRGTTEQTIDLRSLPAASYLLTLHTPDGHSATQRLIVQ